jgi:hypothetical protein
MDLIRKIFWVALFVFSTLCFVVLFEKGPDHFVPNVQKQVGEFSAFLIKTVQDQIHPSKPGKSS